MVIIGCFGIVVGILGIVVISAIFVFIGNLLADISYYFIDPRIKENEFND